MHLKEVLTKWMKLIGVDIRQALIGSIVLGIAAAYGGLLYISKALLNYTVLFLTTPTPLWATISLALLGYLYTCTLIHKLHSSFDTSSEVNISTDYVKNFGDVVAELDLF